MPPPSYPPKPRSPPPEVIEDSDDAHSEHEHGYHAPLPDIAARRAAQRQRSSSSSSQRPGAPKRGSFSSGVGVGAAAVGLPSAVRSRQRAFSAGAAAGGVVTRGGAPPTSEPLSVRKGAVGFDGVEDRANPTGGNGFSDLTRNASRVSQRSNRTFADAAALVSLPDLSREETRTEKRARARSGTVTTMASLRRFASVLSEGISEVDEKKLEEEGEVEELVAVQVTDDGEEIVYPDGGLQVSPRRSVVVCLRISLMPGLARPGGWLLRGDLRVRTRRLRRRLPVILRAAPSAGVLVVDDCVDRLDAGGSVLLDVSVHRPPLRPVRLPPPPGWGHFPPCPCVLHALAL